MDQDGQTALAQVVNVQAPVVVQLEPLDIRVELDAVEAQLHQVAHVGLDIPAV